MVIHEKYTLPPEIESELVALPPPTAVGYLARLQCVSIEVVVIARRQAADRVLRDEIDSILFERSLPRIRAAVKRHSRVNVEELDEAEGEAMLLFWKELQSESFFEVRFNLALKRLAERAGRNIRGGKQRAFERSALRIDSEDSDGRDAPIEVPDADEHSRFEDRDLVEVGLASLPKEQARAIGLHYLLELQIFSGDPTIQTVASELGCGERKARKLIADAKIALGLLIGQEDNDD